MKSLLFANSALSGAQSRWQLLWTISSGGAGRWSRARRQPAAPHSTHAQRAHVTARYETVADRMRIVVLELACSCVLNLLCPAIVWAGEPPPPPPPTPPPVARLAHCALGGGRECEDVPPASYRTSAADTTRLDHIRNSAYLLLTRTINPVMFLFRCCFLSTAIFKLNTSILVFFFIKRKHFSAYTNNKIMSNTLSEGRESLSTQPQPRVAILALL